MQPPSPALQPATRAMRENDFVRGKLHCLQQVPEGTHLPEGKGS